MNREEVDEFIKRRACYWNEIYRKLGLLNSKCLVGSVKTRWRISLNVLNIINDDLKMQGRRFILCGIPIEMECEERDIIELYVNIDGIK